MPKRIKYRRHEISYCGRRGGDAARGAARGWGHAIGRSPPARKWAYRPGVRRNNSLGEVAACASSARAMSSRRQSAHSASGAPASGAISKKQAAGNGWHAASFPYGRWRKLAPHRESADRNGRARIVFHAFWPSPPSQGRKASSHRARPAGLRHLLWAHDGIDGRRH